MTVLEGPELADRFNSLEEMLNTELVERRAEVRGVVTALVAGVHVYLLGSPGIGKTLLVDRLNTYVSDTRVFRILMSRFTTPEEVFGPVSLKGLENDEFVRKIDGYLATCEVGFLDEIFKANSSILNALLWAINERQYRHGTENIDIPLSTIIGASNELPADESLAALYDRLLLRYEVKPVRDTQNFLTMLSTSRPNNPEPILHWNDVINAQQEARQVIIPQDVYEALAELRRLLKDEGIEPTDRRFVESTKLIRASAWLDGMDTADTENLRLLQHAMWDHPEQQAVVSQIVLNLANPLDSEAASLLSEIEKLEVKLNEIVKDEERHRKGTEIHGKLRRAKKELDSIEERAGSGRRRSETIMEVRSRLQSITQRVLVEIFQYEENEVRA